MEFKLWLENRYYHPRYFYHATTCEALPSIFKQGLLPSKNPTWGGSLGEWSQGKICLADTMKEAEYYGNAGIWRGHVNQFHPVLRFLYNPNELKPDPQAPGDYYSEKPIKAKFEIFDETNWRPLTKDIADAIYHGDWDGENPDDEDNYE